MVTIRPRKEEIVDFGTMRFGDGSVGSVVGQSWNFEWNCHEVSWWLMFSYQPANFWPSDSLNSYSTAQNTDYRPLRLLLDFSPKPSFRIPEFKLRKTLPRTISLRIVDFSIPPNRSTLEANQHSRISLLSESFLTECAFFCFFSFFVSAPSSGQNGRRNGHSVHTNSPSVNSL